MPMGRDAPRRGFRPLDIGRGRIRQQGDHMARPQHLPRARQPGGCGSPVPAHHDHYVREPVVVHRRVGPHQHAPCCVHKTRIVGDEPPDKTVDIGNLVGFCKGMGDGTGLERAEPLADEYLETERRPVLPGAGARGAVL